MKLNYLLLVTLPLTLLGGQIEIEPSQDAYTCDCVPNATNPNGGETYLYQGRVGNCYCNYFMEWDLSFITPGTIINSAELWIYCKSFTGSASGNPVYYMITESWNENNVTFNTIPSYDSGTAITSSWPVANEWYVIDFTDFAQAWVDDSSQNFGFLAHVVGATSSSCPGFYSSNFSNEEFRPYLVLSGEEVSLERNTWGEIKKEI